MFAGKGLSDTVPGDGEHKGGKLPAARGKINVPSFAGTGAMAPLQFPWVARRVCAWFHRLPIVRTCCKGCRMNFRCVHGTMVMAKGAASMCAAAQSSAALSVSARLPVGRCLLFDWAPPENTTTNADCFSDAAQQKRVPYLPWYLCIGVARTKLPCEDKSEMQAAEKELAKHHKQLMHMQHCAFAGQRQRTRNIYMSTTSCCTSAISVIQLYSCCF